MKAVELVESQKGSWRKIPITIIDRVLSINADFNSFQVACHSTAIGAVAQLWKLATCHSARPRHQEDGLSHFVSFAGQFNTTDMGTVSAGFICVRIRNRWPSPLTS